MAATARTIDDIIAEALGRAAEPTEGEQQFAVGWLSKEGDILVGPVVRIAMREPEEGDEWKTYPVLTFQAATGSTETKGDEGRQTIRPGLERGFHARTMVARKKVDDLNPKPGDIGFVMDLGLKHSSKSGRDYYDVRMRFWRDGVELTPAGVLT